MHTRTPTPGDMYQFEADGGYYSRELSPGTEGRINAITKADPRRSIAKDSPLHPARGFNTRIAAKSTRVYAFRAPGSARPLAGMEMSVDYGGSFTVLRPAKRARP